LYDGDHFGEAGLIYLKRRTESVIVLEVCELFCLHRRDFKRLFATNSEFYCTLEYRAQTHLQKIEKIEEENLDKTNDI
jgi:CRP-like cAMP-binding protein